MIGLKKKKKKKIKIMGGLCFKSKDKYNDVFDDKDFPNYERLDKYKTSIQNTSENYRENIAISIINLHSSVDNLNEDIIKLQQTNAILIRENNKLKNQILI